MIRARRIRASIAAAVLTAALSLAGPAAAISVTDADYPRSLDQEGPVAVSWSDPAGFSELRFSRNRFEARQGDWVRQIARHLAKRAAGVLAPGERLDVEITDIKRAGDFEPAAGRSDHVRIVRDIYPPSIALSYTRFDAAGTVVDSGTRELTDLGFLHRAGGTVASGDLLRHEKRLVDDWVRNDLARGND
ncbi:DUF3016 domain-containing protein [Luteimonas sp. MJ246]|uniref:DUF3016 domain-containing protein n=1 Tax=Luteimonas sp. MJ174 TaxID=3129237 RepID=UPI0031BB84F1